MKKTELETRAAEILKRLRKKYPAAKCELDFSTPLELAVAAILAAQCTDKRVNMVTPALFKKYRTAKDWAETPQETLEQEVRTTGFFRNKAKSIRSLGAALVAQHGGQLPGDFEALIKLPGIGRKTANLLMGDAFGGAGMIVDTHQIRVNQLLGLTKNSDAEKIEHDLRSIVPQKDWTGWSHHITWHGRYTCVARKPKCSECPLTDICPFFASQKRSPS
jgi:endonuclease-3